MVEINTDAREGGPDAKQPEPTDSQKLLAQNEHIIKTLEGIFWALGGPMVANVHRTTYNALIKEQQAAQKENDADYLNMVIDENPDRLEASYGKLVPILVQAIKELSVKVTALEAA